MNYTKYIFAFALTLCLSLSALKLSAQAPNYIRTYIGAAAGFGRLLIKEDLFIPTSYQANHGECSVKQRVWAMSSQFATRTPNAGKFGLSGYFRFDLGGAGSKWYIVRAANVPAEPVEQKGFDVFIYLRMGIGFARSFNDHTMLGIRYYNSYNADAMRSTYDNSDDAASVGLYGCFNNLSFNIGYSDHKIPGFLVNSSSWSFIQSDFRYHMGNWDDGMMGWYVGIDYEKSFLQDKELLDNGSIVGTQGGQVNFIMFSVGMCAPSKE